MADIPPMPFQWNGEAMVALNGKRADEHFTIGERYVLAEHQDRSLRSHNHYFASVAEAWKNLPEHLAAQFPTAEHLRKYALIKAGYYDSHSIVCASRAEALRVAAFIRPMDEFAIVTVTEAQVTRYTAQSQSKRAMGKKVFQESKDDVLGITSDMVGVEAKALTANAMEAA